MASKPFFAESHGKWRMRWWAGPTKGWQMVTLGPHPGWKKGAKRPVRWPAEIETIARKYRDLETRARHGVEVAPVRAVALREYLEGYRDAGERTLAPGSFRGRKRIVAQFLAFCEAIEVKGMEGVTPRVCRDYLTERSKTIGYVSLKQERVVLSRAWKIAADDGIVTVNPWAKVPVPGKARRDPPPYWTVDEIQRLIDGIKEEWLRDVVIVGVNTGLRISALLSLEWRDIDFEQGLVKVRATNSKSGHYYQVPMSATCREVLDRRFKGRIPNNKLVFPGPIRSGRIHIEHTYVRIRGLVNQLGLPDHGHYNHILRHSFATHAVMRGVPLPIVQSWLGHRSITMTMRYAHVIPSESHRQMQGFDLRPEANTPGTASPPAKDPSSTDG